MTDIKAILNLLKQHIKNKNDYTFTNSLLMMEPNLKKYYP